jgi:hypothetical protein
MSHYIVVTRDNYLYLVGPFISQNDAGDWASNDVNNPSDDPRWQTIQLKPDPARSLSIGVRSPSKPMDR